MAPYLRPRRSGGQGSARSRPANHLYYSMTALLSHLRTHLARTRLLGEPGVALVAVSGGADSVALLDLLHTLTPELGLSLVVAHVDHGIQSDSGAVARAVGELAERYELPFEVGELSLGPDATETVARRARYAWLGDVQRRHGARYLVTAHHRDDQVETILLRLLKGSAPAGLAGIPARGRGGLVRPLLPFTKTRLVAHVTELGLPIHDDPANRDPRHLRSWVRPVLLPLVGERLGARVGHDVLRAGRAAARERRAWDGVLDHLPDLGLRIEPYRIEVARGGLARYDDVLSAALLRAAARRSGLVLGVRRAVRDAAVEVVPTGERGSAVFGEFRVAWTPDPAPARLPRAEWTTWIAGANWEVRPPRPGDRLVPLGGIGRRPLRRMLMEARVPRSDRPGYPVVARGETILWVPGICRSADDLPRPGTRAVRVDVTKHGGPQADGRT